MNKRFLFFIALFFFLIIPHNVFAVNSMTAYGSTINNTTISAQSVSLGNAVSFNLSTGNHFQLDLMVTAFDYNNESHTSLQYFPYVVLQFFTNNPDTDSMSISRIGGCNQSCFGNSYNFKKLWDFKIGDVTYHQYYLILNVSKFYVPADFETYIGDSFYFNQLSGNATYSYFITNVLLSDTSDIGGTMTDDINNIINSQTQNTQLIINNQNSNQAQTNQRLDDLKNQQQQTNQKLDNLNGSITDDNIQQGTGSDFFNDFSTTDNGGISGILTAPLVAINKMLDNTCSPLTATYKGKEISLPCGTDFWVSMGGVKTFLSMLESGILCYAIIKAIFELIHNLKDPDNDKVEVMSL